MHNRGPMGTTTHSTQLWRKCLGLLSCFQDQFEIALEHLCDLKSELVLIDYQEVFTQGQAQQCSVVIPSEQGSQLLKLDCMILKLQWVHVRSAADMK